MKLRGLFNDENSITDLTNLNTWTFYDLIEIT